MPLVNFRFGRRLKPRPAYILMSATFLKAACVSVLIRATAASAASAAEPSIWALQMDASADWVVAVWFR